jgi:hypothetical protein
MIYLRIIGIILCFQLMIFKAYAQWPANINVVTTETNVPITVQGKLEDGKVVDLAWGHHSANNCFPQAANEAFRGNHMLYTTYLPAHSTVKIILKPVVDTVKMSLYGYMVGANNFSSIVPSVHSCIVCKSDYTPPKKPVAPKQNSKSDKPKTPTPVVTTTAVGNTKVIEFKGSGSQGYNVMFGVAGYGEKGTVGAYTIEVLVK